jgi:hypothetical protein
VIVESNFYPDVQREKVVAFGRPVVEVHCVAEPAVLSARFHSRERHPGHTREEPYTSADAARALVANGALAVGRLIRVDTTHPGKIDWDAIIREVGESDGPRDR